MLSPDPSVELGLKNLVYLLSASEFLHSHTLDANLNLQFAFRPSQHFQIPQDTDNERGH
jgi:hypothetical protein